MTDIIERAKEALDKNIGEKDEIKVDEALMNIVKEFVGDEFSKKKERDDLLKAIREIVIQAPKVPEIKIPEIRLPKVDVKVPDFPKIPTPEVIVNVPEVIVPKITVPKPEVTVNVAKPDAPSVTVNAPEVNEVALRDVDRGNPLPVALFGLDGKPANLGGGSGGGKVPSVMSLKNKQGEVVDPGGIKAIDSPSIDAFGRWRVSNPETIFDSKQLWDNAPLFWDDQEVSGATTTSVHSTATASSVMGVALNTAGRRVRQTFMKFNYQPGKSQLILMTGTLDPSGGGTGITRGWGYYDDNDGVFLKDDEGTLKYVIRSSASGSPVDSEVVQASWNLDVMDGSGTSGITLNTSKSFITIVDLEWLGVGRVRVGFVINGLPVYVHEFMHSNVLAGVYMSTPNLPLRYEIENDGTGAASTLEHICSSVISEGGRTRTGILRHVDSGSVSGLSAGTTYAVLGIKLKSTHLDLTVLLEAVSLISTTNNDQLHWELKINPSVVGTFTYSDETNSGVQTASGSSSNTVTGGTDIDGGYFATALPVTSTVSNALRLGSKIDGTIDEIVLTARPITNNITVQGSLTWRELS